MHNMHQEAFSYETLLAAYQADPRVSEIVKDFDQKSITLKTSEVDDIETQQPSAQQSNKVSQMAAKAVDI